MKVDWLEVLKVAGVLAALAAGGHATLSNESSDRASIVTREVYQELTRLDHRLDELEARQR